MIDIFRIILRISANNGWYLDIYEILASRDFPLITTRPLRGGIFNLNSAALQHRFKDCVFTQTETVVL